VEDARADKDRRSSVATGRSGGQEQCLCSARAIVPRPQVLLLDEPCSALNSIAMLKIQGLLVELRREYTIAMYNLQQVAAPPTIRCSY